MPFLLREGVGAKLFIKEVKLTSERAGLPQTGEGHREKKRLRS